MDSEEFPPDWNLRFRVRRITIDEVKKIMTVETNKEMAIWDIKKAGPDEVAFEVLTILGWSKKGKVGV